ncbi:helix-turn-helix transcriptional regulator [Amycolatopsis alkalitolerans]|uniref:Helix-turn-helix transcriptional regulator n=1 Tax=Amycolatopsis alkalitolerans TaxID=2547244 RepID=A0A5C4M3S5_9PSEU|nr:LuxR C-terminal-related transcriptional regulator [Amycolatopsis alkalitolerans]TNC25814.1 helix-turn-helix transcriptional regulator [Amycolatopsis alkalitolerans]
MTVHSDPATDTSGMERMLCWLRYAVAALAVATAAILGAGRLSGTVELALAAVALNGYVHFALRRPRSAAELRSLGRRVLVADTVLTVADYAAFVGDAQAIPAAFVPLLVVELAARFRRPGMVAGLILFVLAIGVRLVHQVWLIPDGAVRLPLLLVWIMLAAFLLALCRELTVRERLLRAAETERERIAATFRGVVGEVLSRCGVPPEAASSTDVLDAVRRICEERSNEYESLAAGIADQLVPAAREFGLTRREREIIGLLAMGYSYERIARALFVSGSTVRNHVHHVRRKLGLSSREEVVAFARRQGLAPSHG